MHITKCTKITFTINKQIATSIVLIITTVVNYSTPQYLLMQQHIISLSFSPVAMEVVLQPLQKEGEKEMVFRGSSEKVLTRHSFVYEELHPINIEITANAAVK